MSKVGLQLYSIKEISGDDFFKAIELTAESGYDGIEFAGFFNTPASELKKVLADNGILACGSHMGIDLLEKDFGPSVEYNQEIDNRYIIIPGLPEDMRNNRDAWLRTAERFNVLNHKLKDSGIRLGYHNHEWEFEEYNGEYGYDIFAANTDNDIILEIDVFWVAYPGLDPIDYVTRYSGRLDLIHIKDMNTKKKSTEVGSGSLDIHGICRAAEKTEWFIVEQEHFAIPQPESIKISCKYLRGVLE